MSQLYSIFSKHLNTIMADLQVCESTVLFIETSMNCDILYTHLTSASSSVSLFVIDTATKHGKIITANLLYNKWQQEAQLPLRNRASATHFFVAKLLSIAVTIYAYPTSITCGTCTCDDTANSLRCLLSVSLNIYINLISPEIRLIGLHFCRW